MLLTRNFLASRKNLALLKKLNVALSQRSRSNQVQEANTHVREFDHTPSPKQRELKKFKEPFPKGIFVGKCDPNVLEFPEVLNLEEIDALNARSKEVSSIIQSTRDGLQTVNETIIKMLAETGIFGCRVDHTNFGLGCTNTEEVVFNESTALNGSLYKFTSEQQVIAYHLLSQHGTAQQKLKYLNPLLKGETIVTCAFQERPSSADADLSVETLALPDGADGYEISGCKDWVYNAALANSIIVFAKTNQQDDTGKRLEGITGFLLPVNSPGVTIHPPFQTIGNKGISVSKVEFLDVKVDKSAVLGELNNGADMLLKVVGRRLNMAPYVVGVGKKLINDLTIDSINSTFMSTPKQELEGVRARLGKMATVLYTLESSVFLAAGHADLYENADSFTETCITKVLASKVLNYLTFEVINLVGSEALVLEKYKYLQSLLENCAFYSACDETNINLRNNIALVGLAHAGLTVHEEVKKVRNRLMFPAFVFKKIMESNKRYGGETGVKLGLEGYLHPSLESAAHVLEYCISRVYMGADALLARYGKEIVEKHMELHLIAEATILTYALTAVLARASRSYCIGLSESETEIEIALAVAAYSKTKIDEIVTQLTDGPYMHNTIKYLRISDRVFANKGYCSESPITRNF